MNNATREPRADDIVTYTIQDRDCGDAIEFEVIGWNAKGEPMGSIGPYLTPAKARDAVKDEWPWASEDPTG